MASVGSTLDCSKTLACNALHETQKMTLSYRSPSLVPTNFKREDSQDIHSRNPRDVIVLASYAAFLPVPKTRLQP